MTPVVLLIFGRVNWGKHQDVYAGESGRMKFPGIRDPKRMLDPTPVRSQIVQLGRTERDGHRIHHQELGNPTCI